MSNAESSLHGDGEAQVPSFNEVEQVSGSRSLQRPLVVAVEGNIGCGKSTFLSFCDIKPGYDVYPEPIEKWRDLQGENLLSRFYEDPTRWAMPFQLYVNMTVLDIYQRPSWKPIKLVERSLLSSRYCFLENMKRSGVIEPLAGFVLDAWYEHAWKDHHSKPHAIVYVRTSPSVAHERLLSRARSEESTVSLNYLEELHQLHEEWILREQMANMTYESDMPIYIIDADQPMQQMYTQYDACLDFLNLLLL